MRRPCSHPRLHALYFATSFALCLTRGSTAQSTQPDGTHLQFDLLLGLHSALVTPGYDDEGVHVPADAGKSIILLPFPAAPLVKLNRELLLGLSTVKIETNPPRKRAKLIGFRILGSKDGHATQATGASAPVYERLLVKPSHRGKTTIEAINSQRAIKRTKAPQTVPPLKNPPATVFRGGSEPVKESDWLALLLEIDPGLEHLEVSLHKEQPERIDVLYLAKANEPLALTERTSIDTPAIQDTLRIARGDSPPMAALALARLGTWRLGATKAPAAINVAITDQIAAGLGAADLRPRNAAWDALVRGPVPGLIEQAAIAKAGAAAHANMTALAARDLRRADGSHRTNILALLNDAWRAGDKAVCVRVVDAVVADGAPDAFAVLDGASPAGLEELFNRLRTESRPAIKAGVARALIGQTPVEREPALLAEARQLKLEIVDPADPMFKRFDDANDPRGRIAVVNALAVVSAAAVRHTAEFARFVEVATGKRQDSAVREAAFNMVIAQAAGTIAPADRQPYGALPLAMPSNGLDGLTAGLVHAVQDGAPGTQVAALAALVRRGESRAAADALRGKRLTADGLAAILGKLVSQPDVAKCDGLFALLMTVLCESDRTSVSVVIRQLEQAAERYPSGAAWRVAAAMRSGADWARLTALNADRDSQTAAAALHWLGAAAHLSQQDRATVAAARQGERAKLLASMHSDRSAHLEGRYGCLLVTEMIEPLDPVRFGPSAVRRWSAPVRVNLFGPIVEIRGASEGYILAAAGTQVGKGRPVKAEAVLPGKAVWPPVLSAATWNVPGVGQDRKRSPIPFNPLVLAGRPIIPEGTEGALNVDAAALVRAGLANAPTEPLAGLSACVPANLTITLRPVGFGALAGTGPSQPPTDSIGAVLLNVLVVLEPLD